MDPNGYKTESQKKRLGGHLDMLKYTRQLDMAITHSYRYATLYRYTSVWVSTSKAPKCGFFLKVRYMTRTSFGLLSYDWPSNFVFFAIVSVIEIGLISWEWLWCSHRKNLHGCIYHLNMFLEHIFSPISLRCVLTHLRHQDIRIHHVLRRLDKAHFLTKWSLKYTWIKASSTIQITIIRIDTT